MSAKKYDSNDLTPGDIAKEINALHNVCLVLAVVVFAAGLISFLSRNGTLNFLTEFEYRTLGITAIVGGLAVISSIFFTRKIKP